MLRWQSKTRLPPPDGNSTISRSEINVNQRQDLEYVEQCAAHTARQSQQVRPEE
jgi:hypothetical protein